MSSQNNKDMDEIVRQSVQQNNAEMKDQTEDTDHTATTNSSVELAIRMSMKKKPSTVDTRTGELVPYKYCSFKLQEFQQFGVGIYLYFKFLKQLTKLFLLLFILSLPLFLCSLGSGKLEKTPMMFEQTSIGNLGSSTEYERIHLPSYIPLSFLNNFDFIDFDDETNSFSKEDGGIVFAWSDLMGTLLFLIFLSYVGINNKAEAQATDDANTTVSDYTVCVFGLPKDCYNREELQHHFQSKNDYGQVVDVAICYNDTGIIKKYLEKSSVMERYQSAIKKEEKKKKIASLQKKAKKVRKQISKIKRRYSKHCICAYVTFNDAESVKKVLYDYPDTFLARLCMKTTLKFRNKYRIKVSRAAEPSEIIYDNMKYSKCNVWLRRSFTFVLSFVAIAVSCSMSLLAATYRQKNLQLNKDALDCPQLDDPLSELHSLADTNDSDYDANCLCSQLTAAQMYDEYELCSNYLTNMSISNALIGGSAAIIIVINLALKFISRVLVNFEKHTSLTKMERELTWKMFVGLFFNTALIILCVNAKFESLQLMFLFEGEYQDFEPEWYQVVGVSLLLTMVMNVANPHLIPIVMHPIQQCKLWCKMRQIRSQTAANKNKYTQRELNAMFEGEAFTLAERYAIICNTIYVSFFYSSGMPVLLLLAAITFWVTYYCDKFVILKRAKTPPKYNVDVAQFTLKLIKPIIYIHLAVSIWVYGSETVMLHHTLGAEDPTATVNADIGYADNFREKVLNYSCFPSFLALVLLIAFDIIRNILTTFKLTQCAASIIRKCLLCFCPCCCKRCVQNENAIHVQEDIDLYLNELAKGMRFESYLASFQELYENAYFNQEMATDTKGLLLKEEPLYVKQNLIAANTNINQLI